MFRRMKCFDLLSRPSVHPLIATRAGSPTGFGLIGLSHLPRYGQAVKLVLPCSGNSCDICCHTARRSRRRRVVDIYTGQEAASVNKALKTDMVVTLAAGMDRLERLIRWLFDLLACLRQQLVSKSTPQVLAVGSFPASGAWAVQFSVFGLLQGHGP